MVWWSAGDETRSSGDGVMLSCTMTAGVRG
jgi:hypothetical protein